jgi:hypothetical protein
VLVASLLQQPGCGDSHIRQWSRLSIPDFNARCTLLTSVSVLFCDFARLERTAAEMIEPNVRQVGFPLTLKF